MSCSYYHSIVVCEDNRVFGYGRNDYGQLGLGHNEDKLRPQAIPFFDGVRIADVACGQYHTLVSAVQDGVFAFGKNDYGQLGMSSLEPRWTPVHVPGIIEKAVSSSGGDSSNVERGNGTLSPSGGTAFEDNAQTIRIACGYYHSMVLRRDGSVFTFGRNDYGQLGIGNNESAGRPVFVDALQSIRISDVTSGCYHSIALSQEGTVYVWGRNNHGQLGIGTTDDCNSPVRVDALAHKNVIQIAAGFYHLWCCGFPH